MPFNTITLNRRIHPQLEQDMNIDFLLKLELFSCCYPPVFAVDQWIDYPLSFLFSKKCFNGEVVQVQPSKTSCDDLHKEKSLSDFLHKLMK